MEKMVLALVTTKKQTQHYFKSHTIMVVTNYPIRKILSKLDLSGKLTKWAIQLGVYDIKYVSSRARKGHVLVDEIIGPGIHFLGPSLINPSQPTFFVFYHFFCLANTILPPFCLYLLKVFSVASLHFPGKFSVDSSFATIDCSFVVVDSTFIAGRLSPQSFFICRQFPYHCLPSFLVHRHLLPLFLGKK